MKGSYTHLLLFNERPCVALSPCARGAPDTMHIFSHVDRDVIAHDVGDVTDIYPSRDEIRTDQPIPNAATTE